MLSHQIFGSWSKTTRQPMEGARQTFRDASKQTRRGFEDVSRSARNAIGDMQDAIVSNPVKAIGASLVAGVLLGWLVKRS